MTTSLRRRLRAISLLAAPLAIALAPAGARAQVLPAAPVASGEITFAVTVGNAPNFTGHVPFSEAAFSGAQLAAAQGHAVVRVADMRTGIGLRDHHMRNAMEADSFPLIRFELLGVTPGAARGDTVEVSCRGRLTLHGQTRDVAAPGSVVIGAGTVEFTATFPVDMTQYGIKPPTRFFGAVKVQPVVNLTAHLRFGAAAAAP